MQAQSAAEGELDSLCRIEARKIKQQLSSAGQNKYNNYNKAHYRNTAERLTSSNRGESGTLAVEDRRSLLSQTLSPPRPTINPISERTAATAESRNAVDRILRVSVVSTVIHELESEPDVGAWVCDGLRLHSKRQHSQCLFCGQQLPHDRVEELEAHFNTAYRDLLREIDRQSEALRQTVSSIDDIRIPDAEVFYERLQDDARNAIAAWRSAQERLRRTVKSLLHALEGKKQRMFESYGVEGDDSDDIERATSALNKVILEHNSTSRHFDERVQRARTDLEECYVMDCLARYRQLRDESGDAGRSLEDLTGEISEVRTTLRQNEQAIVEHRRPAEELNAELLLYLGHSELRFDVRETGYEITRGGVRAESLSEGEKTAIALLYFLKSLRSRDFDLSDGVVVLDDPASSLDAGALFAAVGFIRERTREAGQLFVLTHKFTFFREMRRWLETRARSDESRLYMLATHFEQGTRQTNLRMLDPLLRDYESDYHYLFAQIYRHVHDSGSGDLQQNYLYPNMARRLLERFFAFCRPRKSGRSTLRDQLEAASVPAETATRIVRFTDVHSHGDSIDEPGHDPTVIAEAPQVLRDVLDVMKAEAPTHFEEMRIVVQGLRSS